MLAHRHYPMTLPEFLSPINGVSCPISLNDTAWIARLNTLFEENASSSSFIKALAEANSKLVSEALEANSQLSTLKEVLAMRKSAVADALALEAAKNIKRPAKKSRSNSVRGKVAVVGTSEAG